jgi:hypothetical protein
MSEPQLLRNGQPLNLDNPPFSKTHEALYAKLQQLPDNEVFDTEHLQEKLGLTETQLRWAIRGFPYLSRYRLRESNGQYTWGTPVALNTYRELCRRKSPCPRPRALGPAPTGDAQ